MNRHSEQELASESTPPMTWCYNPTSSNFLPAKNSMGRLFQHRRESVRRVVLLLVGLLVSCGEAPENLEQALAAAQRSWEVGEVSKALIQLKSAVKEHPDSAQARARLADAYLKLNDGVAADKEIEKARVSGLPARDAELLSIRAALARNEFDVALTKFETATDIVNDPRCRALHATILMNREKLDEALDLFSASLEDDKQRTEALMGLARLHGGRGELQVSRRFLDQALTADPRAMDIHMLDAELRSREGDLAGARRALAEARKWNPYSMLPSLAEIRLALNDKDYAAAGRVVDELERKSPNNVLVAFYEGLTHYFKGEYVAAEDSFRRVLSVAPTHAQSQLYLGFIKYRDGNLEQAEQFLTKFLQQNAGHRPAEKLLAAIQIKRGKPELALATLGDLGEEMDTELLGLQASAYFASGKTEAGLNALEAAAKLEPNDETAKLELGIARTQLGFLDEAIALLQPETRLEKSLTRSDFLLLYAYMRKGDWDKTIAVAQEMRGTLGDDPGLLNALGGAYLAKGELDKAREAFEQAFAHDPDTPTILRNLSVLELNQGQHRRAQDYIERLLKLDPKDPRALTLAGRAAEAAGEQSEADAFFEQARASQATALDARMRLGSSYLRSGRYADAAAVSQEVLELAPRYLNGLLNLGQALRGLGKFDMAAQIAAQALEAYPNTPAVEFLAGVVALDSGKVEDAARHLEASDKLLPDNPDVQLALAKLALARGAAPAEVLALIERAEAVLKTESTPVHVLRGDLAAASGDYASAAEQFRAALALGDSEAIAIKLAFALAKSGHSDEATGMLTERVTSHPDSVALRIMLAQLYQLIEREPDAARVYGEALALDPENLLALNNLALIRAANGTDGAEDLADRVYKLAPDNALIADTYGWVHLQRGHLEVGVQALQAAAASAPENPDINFHYAVALARNKQSAQALEVLKRLLATGEFASRAAAEKLAAELERQ